MEKVYYCAVGSWLGKLYIASTEKGLCRIAFEGEEDEFFQWLTRQFGSENLVEDESKNGLASEQLKDYLAGGRREFALSVDLRGTAFQKAVWGELMRIPYGVTVSYKEVAERIGKPAAIRAVGSANGANPIPIVIPCHRVVGSDGSLTGYSAGLEIKKALLRLEGVDF
ncbi:MAG: methylated-DNA--[protein]-cysteine S-methyltransferase [Anaerolineae bacterium]